MEERIIAKREDWTTYDMPKKQDTFVLKRDFNPEELQNLRYGNIPQEMEDKWFWYMEGNTLYAHRSWTGYCIFIVEIDTVSGKHTVVYNCDKEQCSMNSKAEAEYELNMLLNWWVQPQYDYYNEWLYETALAINKAKGLSKGQIYLNQSDITKT